MSEVDPSYDDVRGSSPVMTTKDLLLEVYRDMKFVRPAVEGLLAAGVVARIEAVERDDLAREAAGLNAELVHRVEVLEDVGRASGAAGLERRRLGDLSARSIALFIVVANFAIGFLIALNSLLVGRLS